jgi:hypothetical protein
MCDYVHTQLSSSFITISKRLRKEIPYRTPVGDFLLTGYFNSDQRFHLDL